ncbi:MAG: aspartate--tRNA ligase [Metamycoplasmataceae bacterium]
MKKTNNLETLNMPINSKVTLYGWVSSIRKLGNLNFVILRDRSASIQLILNSKINFTKESVLKVSGIIQKRKSTNDNIETGSIEIIVDEYEILSLARELPFELSDKVNVKEDTRLKYRYLDLRKPEMYQNLKLRHKLIKAFRDFLDSEDFLEIETPILSKSTPEGARDYLVPTRNKGTFFALPQSPQLYKQLLMSSGIEKYFQLAHVFRDEDLRKDRQPEFTQLDIELSFAEEEDIFALSEKMFKFAFDKIGIKIKTPFARMTFKEAIDKYGSDKPDTRFELFLQEGNDIFFKTTSPLLKDKESIKFLILHHEITGSNIKLLEEIATKNKVNKLITIKIYNFKYNENSFNLSISKELDLIIKNHKLENGTIFLVADYYKNTTQSLGAIRNKLNDFYQFANDDEYNFLWVVDFPLFEEENGKIIAMHHPFTSPTKDTIEYLNSNLLKVNARSYDLTLNGFELSSGSVRINNLDLQKKIFNILNLNEKQIQDKFGHFLDAFNYGFPPHAGTAFGIDRILMIITKSQSIRDVIPFPKNTHGYDMMFDSPSLVDDSSLEDLSIIIKK